MSYDSWKTTDPADADPYRDTDCPVCGTPEGYRCTPECDCEACVTAKAEEERDQMSKATNCACPVGDARDCYDLRYPLPVDDLERETEIQNRIQDREACECPCHEVDPDEDDSERDEAYERAAARARLNDFEDSPGRKDWT